MTSIGPTLRWAGLVVPPALVVGAYLLSIPDPKVTVTDPSLASLPVTSPVRELYPEDFYSNGNYAKLPSGNVRYWINGPEKGIKVVLVHGFSIPSPVWKDIVPRLVAAGFRVLVYDLYGRGYSEAPRSEYDANLYVTQLALLMQYVGWEKARVVGLSMGGGIAASFAQAFPHLVDGKVALIAAAGLMTSDPFLNSKRMLFSPLVQALLSTTLVKRFLQRSPSRLPADSHMKLFVQLIHLQSVSLPGYNRALASSFRNGPLRASMATRSAFESLARPDLSVLVIWGTQDKTVDIRYGYEIRKIVPEAKWVPVEGADHDLTTSHPEEVVKALVEFLMA